MPDFYSVTRVRLLSHYAPWAVYLNLVRLAGFGPARSLEHGGLSPACLPFHHKWISNWSSVLESNQPLELYKNSRLATGLTDKNQWGSTRLSKAESNTIKSSLLNVSGDEAPSLVRLERVALSRPKAVGFESTVSAVPTTDG